MPAPITDERAGALRAKLEALKTADAKRYATVRDSISKTSFYKFVGSKGKVTEATATKLEALLDGKPSSVDESRYEESRPRGNGHRGRIHLYLRKPDAATLRAEVKAYVDAKHGGSWKEFATALGYRSVGGALGRTIVRADKRVTVKLAERLRAGMAGKNPPLLRRALAVVPGPKPRSKPGPKPSETRAPRNILATLRLDVGNVLESRGGSVTALARELAMRTSRLTRFLDGGPLTFDEAGEVANRLSAMRTPPALALVRRANGIEAYHGGQKFAQEIDLPIEPPSLRARSLAAKWGQEAIQLVLQLAQGGGAA